MNRSIARVARLEREVRKFLRTEIGTVETDLRLTPGETADSGFGDETLGPTTRRDEHSSKL